MRTWRCRRCGAANPWGYSRCTCGFERRPPGIHAFDMGHAETLSTGPGTYDYKCRWCEWVAPEVDAEGRGGCAALGRSSRLKAAIRAHIIQVHPELNPYDATRGRG